MSVALVFGATGLVGKFIVNSLLSNDNFIKVKAITRRVMKITQNDKFQNILIKDFNRLSEEKEKIFQGATHVFCSLGTTRSKAGSAQEFYRVDHDIVMNIASLSKEFDTIKWFGYVSSFGANSNSYFLYPRTKGQVEEDLFIKKLPQVQIYRPGFLLGTREIEQEGKGEEGSPSSTRYWESIAIAIVKVLRWFSPQNLAIDADVLAQVMVWDSIHPSKQSFAINSNSDIMERAKEMLKKE